MSDSTLDSMLLSIDNNKSMTATEKAAANSKDSSTTVLETEDSKNRRQAKAFATEALGPISDPDEWVGPISSEMIAFILEAVEGTHGPCWAKKFFDNAKRVIPGETSAT